MTYPFTILIVLNFLAATLGPIPLLITFTISFISYFFIMGEKPE